VAPQKRDDGRAARRNAGVRASAVGDTARLLGRMAGGGCSSLSTRHCPAGRIHARTGERGSSARACACVCAPCCGIALACMCECMCVCMGVVGEGGARPSRRQRRSAPPTPGRHAHPTTPHTTHMKHMQHTRIAHTRHTHPPHLRPPLLLAAAAAAAALHPRFAEAGVRAMTGIGRGVTRMHPRRLVFRAHVYFAV
jgi:hypothetical protein